MVAKVSRSSNVRAAPRAISPLLVNRLLSIFEGIEPDGPTNAAPAPRLRLGAPTSASAPICRPHPLQDASAALAFIRTSGVSASVAETSQFGTLWWVSGHPMPLNAAAIIELAKQMGFGSRG